MIEYYVKEIKGHEIGNAEILWLDCNIHNRSKVLTLFENNILIYQFYVLDTEVAAIFHFMQLLKCEPAVHL